MHVCRLPCRSAASTPVPDSGFTLFELVLVIAIISIFVAVALDRLLPYIDEAERVAVLRVEGQLRSTLVMEAAERIARGDSASISELNGTNPVKFLLEPPKNYVGELPSRLVADAPPRHWYFDRGRRHLVYQTGEPFALPVGEVPLEDPAFVVWVEFADRDRTGRFDPSRDELHGVRLVRVAGADWLTGGSLGEF